MAVSETEKPATGNATTDVREITVAHSPDSDDAFMFYGLATNKVRTSGSAFHAHVVRHRNAESKGAGRRLRRHRNFVSRLSISCRTNTH